MYGIEILLLCLCFYLDGDRFHSCKVKSASSFFVVQRPCSLTYSLSLSPRQCRTRPQNLSGLECQPNRLGDLLGEVSGGVEVFTKEAYLAFYLAGDDRAALACDH